MTDLSAFEEAGRQLGHLVNLCRADDPTFVLLFEEIERLTTDDAMTLLLAAVMLLAQGQTI